MRNLGPISPDFVYGSSADTFPLENQGGMEGQSQRLPSVENEERPAFAPEQAKKSGVSLHSAPQVRQVGGNAKPSSGGDQPTVTHSASNRAQEGAERSVVAARAREATGETPVRKKKGGKAVRIVCDMKTPKPTLSVIVTKMNGFGTITQLYTPTNPPQQQSDLKS
eukprot:SAG11_NODE_12042_length_724_cov_2.041600_1_plen_166_part_00